MSHENFQRNRKIFILCSLNKIKLPIPEISTINLNRIIIINSFMEPHNQIFDWVSASDEITWRNLIYEAIRQERMDPWDIDVSSLTKKYLEMLKTLKHMDFNVSGKVLLAAAILLKIKSKRLVNEDITELDSLMATEEADYEGFYDDLEAEYQTHGLAEEEAVLYPHVPQPRQRKVSVYDLVNALQRALEVKHRRVLRNIPAVKVEIPEKRVDITELIKDVYDKIKGLFMKNKKITFSQLVQSEKKEDKIRTFIPLLHLAHVDQRKIDLSQKEPFGEIEIKLYNKDLQQAL